MAANPESDNVTFLVSTQNGESVTQLTLDKSTTIENVKAFVLAQLGITPSALSLHSNVLSDLSTLAQAGVKNHDMLAIIQQPGAGAVGSVSSSGSVPQGTVSSFSDVPPNVMSDPALFQKYVRANPDLLQYLLHQRPELAEAVLAEDTDTIRQFFEASAASQRERTRAQNERQARLAADPFNPDLQREIEEEIRLKNVEQNMEHAIEHLPESFGSVVMLYVPCEVNGHELNAFVDSGAQSTIMSKACAERLGIMRLVDSRFSGVAKGVGTAKIIGRVHMAQIKIGTHNLNCSFTILDQNSMEFLFGLDMLRRHQACIDLKNNCLRIGEDEVQFLGEKDIRDMEDDEKTDFPEASSSQSSNPGVQNPGSESQALVSGSLPPSQASNPGPQPGPSTSSSVVSRPPAAALASPQPVVSGSSATQFPEASIQALTGLGFTRDQASRALQVCQGNVEMAASFLFQSAGGGSGFGF
eukprot:139189_1